MTSAKVSGAPQHATPIQRRYDTIPHMKPLPILLALFATTAVFAADPEGFAMYKASDITARANAAKLDEYKPRAVRVPSWGNHGLILVRREGDGAVESHETQVDGNTVVSGVRSLLLGP